MKTICLARNENYAKKAKTGLDPLSFFSTPDRGMSHTNPFPEVVPPIKTKKLNLSW